MKDDEGMLDFRLFWGFGFWFMTDERTNERTDEQTFVNVESLSRLKILS